MITARRADNLLHLSVSDNGVGMDASTLERIRFSLAEEAKFTEIGHRSGQSIGLKNIHTRIQLYYGRQYGLTLESEPSMGTSITITIPIQEVSAAPSTKVETEEEK